MVAAFEKQELPTADF